MQAKPGALLILLVMLCLPLVSFAQATDSLLIQMARKWENAKVYTLGIAALMPEEYYDFKPTPEEMSFKEQLVHTAQNMQWLSTAYLSGDYPLKPAKDPVDKAAVLQLLAQSYDAALKAHKALNPTTFRGKR